jgi:hypothetical protein
MEITYDLRGPDYRASISWAVRAAITDFTGD